MALKPLIAGLSQNPVKSVLARNSTSNIIGVLSSSATARPGVLICGDSIADAASLTPFFYNAQQTIGVAGIALGAMGGALGGAASASIGNPATWLGGKTYLLSGSGDYVEFYSPTGGQFLADTIHAFYTKSSGAGSFKIQTSTNGGAWTDEGSTITTANASTISAVTTITKATPVPLKVRLTWISDTVRVIGIGLVDSTRGGVVLVGCSAAGVEFTDASAGVAATTDPVFTTLAPKLAFVLCRDGAPSAASLTATINAYESTGTRELDWVFVAMPPSDSPSQTNASQLAYNSAVKSYALANYRGFVDCYSPIGSLAEWTASGFAHGDGLHLTSAGYQWLANTVWNGSGLSEIRSVVSDVATTNPMLFRPSQLDGLTLWLDASTLAQQGSTEMADGTAVDSWPCRAKNTDGAEIIFTAASTARPLYKRAVQNSLPSVLFDGVNDAMSAAPYWFGLVTKYERTAFIVCKPTAQAAVAANITYSSPNLISCVSQYDGISVSPSGAGNVFTAWDYDSVANRTASTGVSAVNAMALVESWHADGVHSIALNQGTPSTVTLRELTPSGNTVQLGTSGSSAFFAGYLCEVVFYERCLTAAERTQVGAYLRAKWNF